MFKKIVFSPISYGIGCLGLLLFIVIGCLAMLALRQPRCEACPSPPGSVPEARPLVDTDGILYSVAHQTLFAFEDTSGKLLWQYSKSWLNPTRPVVSEGVLYMSLTLREESYSFPYSTWVYAFHGSSGQVLWHTRIFSSSTPLFSPSPQVVAGIVYAQASDGATLFALRANDGKVLWNQNAEGSSQDFVKLMLATPGIAYLNAYHSPAGQILARRISDGAVLWQYSPPSCFPGDGPVLSGRLYISDICNGEWGETVALQAETGKLLWRFSKGGSITATRAVVYVNETDHNGPGVDSVFAVDAATGQMLWKRVISRGVVAGETHIWAATDEVVYATMNGIWYALATRDGKPLWQFPRPNSTELGPDEGTLLHMQTWVVSANVAYLFNGLFQAFNASTGTLLWTFSALSVDPIALSAGIIYLSGLAPAQDEQAVFSPLQKQEITAIEAKSGKVLWHTIQTQQSQVVAQHGIYLSVATGKPYHYTYRILALQSATGKQMWTAQQ